MSRPAGLVPHLAPADPRRSVYRCWVIVYHRSAYALTILDEGFRDGTGQYLTDEALSGVWVSDRPLTSEAGIPDDIPTLAIDVPESVLEPYEWVEEDKGYGEWLVPADLLNECAPPQLVERED